jgi:hypothetical protein
MTSPFDSATPLLCKWFVYTFYPSLSVQKLFDILVLTWNCHCGWNFVFLEDFRPVSVSSYQRDPKRYFLASNSIVWAIMNACATLDQFGRYGIPRNIYLFNIERKSHRVCIFPVCVGARRIQPVAMEVCTYVKVPNVTKPANFGGCMWRGFVYAKGRFWAFPIGSCYGPNNNSLRYRAGMGLLWFSLADWLIDSV